MVDHATECGGIDVVVLLGGGVVLGRLEHLRDTLDHGLLDLERLRVEVLRHRGQAGVVDPQGADADARDAFDRRLVEDEVGLEQHAIGRVGVGHGQGQRHARASVGEVDTEHGIAAGGLR